MLQEDTSVKFHHMIQKQRYQLPDPPHITPPSSLYPLPKGITVQGFAF